ncbi:DUF4870 family protein [Halomonas sp. V046]|uniref:DUF4870 family protein n=1 Tax=Halomonas sp. V046 TaxID=3459611 RepID=UPI004044131A
MPSSSLSRHHGSPAATLAAAGLQPSTTTPPAAVAPGFHLAMVLYGLYLGAVMAVVTAPIAVLIAHAVQRRQRYPDWIRDHLRFLTRTFWYSVLGTLAGLGLWWLFGAIGLPALTSWTFGYLAFTATLVWTVGRCGFGIHRLMERRSPFRGALGAPHSVLADSAPADSALADSAPADSALADSAPADSALADSAPADSAPANSASS